MNEIIEILMNNFQGLQLIKYYQSDLTYICEHITDCIYDSSNHSFKENKLHGHNNWVIESKGMDVQANEWFFETFILTNTETGKTIKFTFEGVIDSWDNRECHFLKIEE